MSKLHLDLYSKMMNEVSGNLKNEIEELSKKVKQARESENWGTYKNLILAYKEIIKMYNDIAIDVSERDVDKTQHIQTTISLDKDTSGIVAKVIEGVIFNNAILDSDGFVRKSKESNIKIIDLFDDRDRRNTEIHIDGNSLMMNVNMSKLLSNRLIGCDKNTLINVKGFRGIGKTHELIKFAREWNFLVLVQNEFLAEEYRREYNYTYIYSQKSNQLVGIEIRDCVIDEGVDYRYIKDELGLNIITGYTNKVETTLK